MKGKLSAARKRLLVRLERLVGNQCYNGNIQNWGPGGVFEGEGREFRYPVTTRLPSGEKKKFYSLPEDLPDDTILGAYYAFGANELHITRALNDIVSLLEREYGLDIESNKT